MVVIVGIALVSGWFLIDCSGNTENGKYVHEASGDYYYLKNGHWAFNATRLLYGEDRDKIYELTGSTITFFPSQAEIKSGGTLITSWTGTLNGKELVVGGRIYIRK